MINTVLDYLENSYRQYSSKVAIVDRERQITYKELYFDTLQVACWINSEFDTMKRPIIVLMNNSECAIASFLGVALSGNIYVPLDAEIPIERLKIIITTLNPLCIISCTEKSVEKYQEIYDRKIIKLEEIKEIKPEYNKAFIKKDKIIDSDPLYILFTSGSTGIPKGVVIQHRAVLDFVEEASESMKFSENEVFLNQAPFYFDASVPDIYCTIRNGATLHIVDKSMFVFPIKLVEYISEHKINALYWVPSALVAVANWNTLQKRDISCLKKIMFCGEVMPTKQLNEWRKVLPSAMYVNYYGPSETTYASCYYIIDRKFANDEILPIGKPAKNTRIILIDGNKEINECYKIGEIYIGGTGVGLGYYNDLERTKQNFVQNPLHQKYPEILYKTGDLAHYDENGDLVYDGRIDYQIKHRGYRIELGEIESCINSMDQIKQVVCLYNEERDMIYCVYCGEIDKDNIYIYLKDKLPAYMIPQRMIQLNSLPINANGKIDRLKLKNMIMDKGES